MKKYVSLLLCTLLLLHIIPVSAQYIENSDFGIFFALSDNWVAGTNGSALRYRYNGKGGEYIDIRQKAVNNASITTDNESIMYNLATTLLSDETIKDEFSKANDVTVEVNTQYQANEYITYNNVRYYKYEKIYIVSAEGYNSSTYYDYIYLTVRNSKLYIISYSRLSTQNHSSEFIDFMNSLYFNLNDIKIVVNNKTLQPDSAPYIQNDRALVPVRAIAEALNYIVNWDAESRTVTLQSADGSKSIRLCIDQNTAMINETQEITLDVAPTIKDDRTFLPVRAVAESLGAQVKWDDATRMIYIW